ncbi:MAG TPA: hypothetical protein VF395_15645 [Polyangiaceae bacterium]
MASLLALLAVAYIIGRLFYWLVIDREVPGGWERRFGSVEDLPADVGQWKVDDQSREGKMAAERGLKREVRVFHDVQTGKLTRQARCRNAATNAIASVEADVPLPSQRRRV